MLPKAEICAAGVYSREKQKLDCGVTLLVQTLFKSCSLFRSVDCHDTMDGNVLICFQVKWKFSVAKNKDYK